MDQPNAAHLSDPDSWKSFSKTPAPFFALPSEIHLKIFALLNPIDGICLSLTCSYVYGLCPEVSPERVSNTRSQCLHQQLQPLPLSTGSPFSENPVIKRSGCRHCVPVLFFPAHCELHYHIREFIPTHLRYCAGKCAKFTVNLADRLRTANPEEREESLRRADGTPRLDPGSRFERSDDASHDVEMDIDDADLEDDEDIMSGDLGPDLGALLAMAPVLVYENGRSTFRIPEDALRNAPPHLRRELGQSQQAHGGGQSLSRSAQQPPEPQNRTHLRWDDVEQPTPQSPTESPHPKEVISFRNPRQATTLDEKKSLCGTCGVSYRRRYERGRRHLNTNRPDGERVREWYNSTKESDADNE